MSERLPVIYVAGPYRAATPWKIQQHIRSAHAAALEIWKLGAVAICPHANTALFDGEAPDDVWLSGDLELLRRCDALLAAKGFNDSQGALAEHRFARSLGLPIFGMSHISHNNSEMAFRRELKEWIDGWKKSQRAESEIRFTPLG